jgi:hypothetical protein
VDEIELGVRSQRFGGHSRMATGSRRGGGRRRFEAPYGWCRPSGGKATRDTSPIAVKTHRTPLVTLLPLASIQARGPIGAARRAGEADDQGGVAEGMELIYLNFAALAFQATISGLRMRDSSRHSNLKERWRDNSIIHSKKALVD